MNTGKGDLTVFKKNKKRGGGAWGDFLCESFVNRKPNDGPVWLDL